MKTDGNKASIRDVYELSQRINDQLVELSNGMDKRLSSLEQRVASIEGRAAVIAIAWSSLVTILATVIGSVVLFVLKK